MAIKALQAHYFIRFQNFEITTMAIADGKNTITTNYSQYFSQYFRHK